MSENTDKAEGAESDAEQNVADAPYVQNTTRSLDFGRAFFSAMLLVALITLFFARGVDIILPSIFVMVSAASLAFTLHRIAQLNIVEIPVDEEDEA